MQKPTFGHRLQSIPHKKSTAHAPPAYGAEDYRGLKIPAKTTYYGEFLPGAARAAPFATVDPGDKHLAALAKKSKYKPRKLPPKRFDPSDRGRPAAVGPTHLQLGKQQPSMGSVNSPRSIPSRKSPSQLSGERLSALSSHVSTNMRFYQPPKQQSPAKGS